MVTITVSQNIKEGEALVAIPKREYKRLLRLQARMNWEEKDTDESIRVFRKEKKRGVLKIARSFGL